MERKSTQKETKSTEKLTKMTVNMNDLKKPIAKIDHYNPPPTSRGGSKAFYIILGTLTLATQKVACFIPQPNPAPNQVTMTAYKNISYFSNIVSLINTSKVDVATFKVDINSKQFSDTKIDKVDVADPSFTFRCVNRVINNPSFEFVKLEKKQFLGSKNSKERMRRICGSQGPPIIIGYVDGSCFMTRKLNRDGNCVFQPVFKIVNQKLKSDEFGQENVNDDDEKQMLYSSSEACGTGYTDIDSSTYGYLEHFHQNKKKMLTLHLRSDIVSQSGLNQDLPLIDVDQLPASDIYLQMKGIRLDIYTFSEEISHLDQNSRKEEFFMKKEELKSGNQYYLLVQSKNGRLGNRFFWISFSTPEEQKAQDFNSTLKVDEFPLVATTPQEDLIEIYSSNVYALSSKEILSFAHYGVKSTGLHYGVFRTRLNGEGKNLITKICDLPELASERGGEAGIINNGSRFYKVSLNTSSVTVYNITINNFSERLRREDGAETRSCGAVFGLKDCKLKQILKIPKLKKMFLKRTSTYQRAPFLDILRLEFIVEYSTPIDVFSSTINLRSEFFSFGLLQNYVPETTNLNSDGDFRVRIYTFTGQFIFENFVDQQVQLTFYQVLKAGDVTGVVTFEDKDNSVNITFTKRAVGEFNFVGANSRPVDVLYDFMRGPSLRRDSYHPVACSGDFIHLNVANMSKRFDLRYSFFTEWTRGDVFLGEDAEVFEAYHGGKDNAFYSFSCNAEPGFKVHIEPGIGEYVLSSIAPESSTTPAARKTKRKRCRGAESESSCFEEKSTFTSINMLSKGMIDEKRVLGPYSSLLCFSNGITILKGLKDTPGGLIISARDSKNPSDFNLKLRKIPNFSELFPWGLDEVMSKGRILLVKTSRSRDMILVVCLEKLFDCKKTVIHFDKVYLRGRSRSSLVSQRGEAGTKLYSNGKLRLKFKKFPVVQSVENPNNPVIQLSRMLQRADLEAEDQQGVDFWELFDRVKPGNSGLITGLNLIGKAQSEGLDRSSSHCSSADKKLGSCGKLKKIENDPNQFSVYLVGDTNIEVDLIKEIGEDDKLIFLSSCSYQKNSKEKGKKIYKDQEGLNQAEQGSCLVFGTQTFEYWSLRIPKIGSEKI